jgi:hypothetical protein
VQITGGQAYLLKMEMRWIQVDPSAAPEMPSPYEPEGPQGLGAHNFSFGARAPR